MIVMSGTIERSWNSRIEKARSPKGVWSRRTQHRQYLRRRGKRERKRQRDRGGQREGGGIIDERDEREAAGDHLDEPEPEYVLPQTPKPRGVKLEPDEEEQQHDAELGHAQLVLGIADEAEPLRPDQRARHQIAQHRAEAEAPESQHEDKRRP
jgi:hypothetical protein